MSYELFLAGAGGQPDDFQNLSPDLFKLNDKKLKEVGNLKFCSILGLKIQFVPDLPRIFRLKKITGSPVASIVLPLLQLFPLVRKHRMKCFSSRAKYSSENNQHITSM